MKNLNIKITGVSSKFHPYMMIDGQSVKYKKNQFGSYEINYQTEKEVVEMHIYKYLELQSKFWFLYALFTFIISLFGILEPLYDKRCIVVDCKFSLKLKEQNQMKLQFNNMIGDGKAVEVESDFEVTEIANKYYIDEKVKKRWKFLIAFKVLFWVALIIVTIVLLTKFL